MQNSKKNCSCEPSSPKDQNQYYCIPCKNTDIFVKLEIKLYEDYPEYKEKETYFVKNGERIIEKKDYYDILGVEKTADETQIKKAYRKLAIKFHPDKNKAKNAEEAFKKVNQAFSVLSDKKKRQNYDMFGTEEGPGLSMPTDFNPFDIFEQFFGDLGGAEFSGFSGGPGRTRVTFNNGSGSFTDFSSGFGGNPFFSGMDEDDGDLNPFEELFFGQRRHRENNNRSRGTSHDRRNNERKGE